MGLELDAADNCLHCLQYVDPGIYNTAHDSVPTDERDCPHCYNTGDREFHAKTRHHRWRNNQIVNELGHVP